MRPGKPKESQRERTPPHLKTTRVDLALNVMQTDAESIIVWFTRGEKKGVFIFRPSEIQSLDDLNEHFFPTFDIDQVYDLTKLLGGSTYHFRATLFELRGIMKYLIASRSGQRL